ncbi:hypothetical protein [Nocardia miyunensis]|uniref:hypothetical protein n=1 Tax=Nocardia miyunensis TaxID=282684 RepID=UPI000B0F28F6|nr:hypothetical protein [Nocardia miyunensis]
MVIEYEEVTDWGTDEWDRDVSGIAVDSRDQVYALRRGEDAVTVLDRDGTVVDRWSDDDFSERPHLISIDHEDKIHIADDGGHRVYVFDSAGKRLEVIGSGAPSQTGFDATSAPSRESAFDRMHGGPPFNRPTKAVSSRNGELFVSDGYRNCRVHRFSPDRKLVHSWGAPGAAPGCFVIPHSITIDNDGRILVCDRENDRIQVFDRDGELLELRNDVQRPTDVAIDQRGYAYVTELARGPLDLKSWRLGPAERELPGRVTVFSPDRTVVARIAPPRTDFLAPHAIAVDSTGAIYVSEVPESFARSTGRAQQRHRCLHKFVPRAMLP